MGGARGGDVVPIPGTKRRTRLAENVAALGRGAHRDERPASSRSPAWCTEHATDALAPSRAHGQGPPRRTA